MKYLERLDVIDHELLADICKNPQLSSFPGLAAFEADIGRAYHAYQAAAGAPPAEHPLMPPQLCSAMRKHYASEIQSVKGFIKFIRHQLSPGVCPVCGGAGPSTVDHVYPQGPWPVFSFFSMNLVPACDQCNRKKNDSFHGDGPDERPIHPYFDQFLTDRVAQARFHGARWAPSIEIVPTATVPAFALPMVTWHLANVVRKTTIESTLQEHWLNICRDPSAFYETIEDGVPVPQAVARKLRSFDRLFGTPNNWESMLQAGILSDPDALQYLASRVAEPNPQP